MRPRRPTTASDPIRDEFRRNRLRQSVVAVLAVAWVAAAIDPLNRMDWLLENLLVFVAAAAALATHRRWPLSELSWLLIAAFLLLHTVGSHYTYSEVPAGFWLRDQFGLARNHYDRIVHFAFGLLITYPVLEAMRRWSGAGPRWCLVCAFAVMATASDLFEIAEWLVASVVDPRAAAAYLGMQGDVFDAQKDVALAHLGSLIALAIIIRWSRWRQPLPRTADATRSPGPPAAER